MAHSEETGGVPDAEELHDYATQAAAASSKLATGLAASGADPATAQACEKMSDIFTKISSGLAKGMKASAPEEPHTMDSAMEATMAERAAAQQQPPAAA